MSSEPMENAGVAFALVCAAGGATAIGASVVFFPRLAKLANRRFLGCSLGLAAGVMLYVSLVDIYGKSITGFTDSGHSDEAAFMYTSISFFGGIFLMMAINWLVDKLLKLNGRKNVAKKAASNKKEAGDCCPGCPSGPEALDKIQDMADSMARRACEEEEEKKDADTDAADGADKTGAPSDSVKSDAENPLTISTTTTPPQATVNHMDMTIKAQDEEVDEIMKEDAAQLLHMGFATALAIAIHNFPEGLVTFVAYTQEPAVGIILAIGIGIHNIPEGLCVAMPIFYATGNRWKAFMWAILSGVSEPIGALIGYLVLKGSMSGNTYGIMFGLVAGIMTLIAADELLPTAHRYDPKNEYVTYAFIVGMAAISASLVLFGQA